MRIGFDVSQTGNKKAGCGYFAESLMRELATIHADNTYILYPTFGPGYWDPDWARSTLQVAELNVVRGPAQRRLDLLESFWLETAPDFEARLLSPDVIHSNNFFCPTRLERARLVYTLHDLVFASHPEWTTEANWRTCFTGVFNASVFADHVVAVSEFTRQQFLDLFPHFPSERISVVHEASRFAGDTPGGKSSVLSGVEAGRYWLAVGTDDARKNCRRLLEAYARLRTAGVTIHPLILFGGHARGDGVDAAIDALGIRGSIMRLGYVDDPTLRWLYANCFAFCYPSLVEGFGLPVIEAMSLGAAVLTSNITSLPEVVGDAGIQVDPTDLNGILLGMQVLATQPETLSGLRGAAQQRAKQFSWRTAARQVLGIYERVTAQPKRTAAEMASAHV